MLPALSTLSTAFRTAQTVTALRSGTWTAGQVVRTAVDLGGAELLMRGLLAVVPRMMARARKVDRSALGDMVRRAQRDVAVDTGRLFNGITGEMDADGMAVFSASAVRVSGRGQEGADYARFVEFGTKPGLRGRPTVGDEAYFTRTEYFASGRPGLPGRQFRIGRRLRRIHHPHPGTEARPFFYGNARDVLAERGIAMQDVIAAAGADEGFETQ